MALPRRTRHRAFLLFACVFKWYASCKKAGLAGAKQNEKRLQFFSNTIIGNRWNWYENGGPGGRLGHHLEVLGRSLGGPRGVPGGLRGVPGRYGTLFGESQRRLGIQERIRGWQDHLLDSFWRHFYGQGRPKGFQAWAKREQNDDQNRIKILDRFRSPILNEKGAQRERTCEPNWNQNWVKVVPRRVKRNNGE